MGVYLSTPNTAKESDFGDNHPKISYGASAMQGWRTGMEDAHMAHLDFPNGIIFGVFDGHGGKDVALFAAKYMGAEIQSNEAYRSGNIEQALHDGFLRIDELLRSPEGLKALREISGRETFKPNNGSSRRELIQTVQQFARTSGVDLKGLDDEVDQEVVSPSVSPNKIPEEYSEAFSMGATSVVALITNGKLYVANAGDSRCILSRAGESVAMSRDHKPQDADEMARIYKAGGYVDAGRVNSNLNLSRALGDLEYKKSNSIPAEQQIITANPEIKILDLVDQDEFLLLACDGVWDVMTNQQAIDFVRSRLIQKALQYSPKNPLLSSIPTKEISTICEELLDNCLAKDALPPGLGCDNMTAVIVLLDKNKVLSIKNT